MSKPYSIDSTNGIVTFNGSNIGRVARAAGTTYRAIGWRGDHVAWGMDSETDAADSLLHIHLSAKDAWVYAGSVVVGYVAEDVDGKWYAYREDGSIVSAHATADEAAIALGGHR